MAVLILIECKPQDFRGAAAPVRNVASEDLVKALTSVATDLETPPSDLLHARELFL